MAYDRSLPPILLDFESRSRADLRAVGGRLYWEDASTEALCAVLYDLIDQSWTVWFPGDAPPACIAGRMLAAHNAMGFDRFAAVRTWGADCYPHERWIDTSELARRGGLPGALDALGTLWLKRPKDKVASKFTTSLSSVRRPTKKTATPEYPEISPEVWRTMSKAQKRSRGVLPVVTPDALERVTAYCVSDVEILVHGYPLLEPFLEYEPEVLHVDRVVNDRGVGFDRALALRLIEEIAYNIDRDLQEIGDLLGMPAADVRSVASSPAQFTARTGLPDSTARTIQDALDGEIPVDDETFLLCKARQAIAAIAQGKLLAGLARTSADGRMRDVHRYIGAHTWRWSGKGMQLQNMPRPAERFETITSEELEALVAHVMAGGHVDAEEIDVLLRATLVAAPGKTFIDVDFVGVESRGLAFFAQDEVALDTIRNKRDPYKVAATAVYGVTYEQVTKPQRQAGKVAELACGYQGGAGAIERFSRSMGIDLESAGTTAAEVVKAWREQRSATKRFWYMVEDAFRDAVEYGEASVVAGFEFCPANDGTGDVAVFLPSGRPIVYPTCRAGEKNQWGKRSLSYRGQKGREHVYGGKLVENLIQAFCRELLAWAMVRLQEEGFEIVLHVHDQVLCEEDEACAEEAYARVIEVVTELPEWAKGFPIAADGHVGRRHKK